MRYVILGTAGHIDHGKSSLVKALTGIDPDRLKEEKERGITIDLGFADLTYPDGLTVGIVDVPGHERLVRNMLAGAGGIDLVLLVIAADEGIMPQSREHLAICNLLRIKSGLVAVTKADLVENDWLELVIDDVKNFVKGSFLDGSEIVPVSSKTGYNLDLLREKIRDVSLKVEQKPESEVFRLPIDRVFTMRGFGTVVTGTLISGSLSLDDPLEILPSRITSKVRGLHSHGKAIGKAHAGQRVAINLQALDKEDLRRGDVVVTPKRVVPTRIIDARIEVLKDAPLLKSRSSVHFHLTTSETIARVVLYDTEEVKPGGSCYCQLRLDDPVVAFSGDRFVIRRFSPVITIGGGTVLDPFPQRRKRREGTEDLRVFESGSLADRIAMKIKKSGVEGMDSSSLTGWVKAEIPAIERSVKELKAAKILIQLDSKLFHRDIYDLLSERVKKYLEDFHRRHPLSPGMPKEELRVQLKVRSELWGGFLSSLQSISVDKELIRLRDHHAVSSDAAGASQKVLAILGKARFQPPAKDEIAEALSMPANAVADLLRLMSKEGKLVRINDSLYVTPDVHEDMLSLLRSFFSKKPTMTVAEFRDMLGTTRKYALPFLEYTDSNKITMRVGEIRKLLLK
jgi:selenocysteine-specific elongation factor